LDVLSSLRFCCAISGVSAVRWGAAAGRASAPAPLALLPRGVAGFPGKREMHSRGRDMPGAAGADKGSDVGQRRRSRTSRGAADPRGRHARGETGQASAHIFSWPSTAGQTFWTLASPKVVSFRGARAAPATTRIPEIRFNFVAPGRRQAAAEMIDNCTGGRCTREAARGNGVRKARSGPRGGRPMRGDAGIASARTPHTCG
jgi:hypothetical protein